MLIIVFINFSLKAMFSGIVASALLARVTLELIGAMVSELIVLVLLVLYLRRCGLRLRQLRMWRPSPRLGWIVAFVGGAV